MVARLRWAGVHNEIDKAFYLEPAAPWNSKHSHRVDTTTAYTTRDRHDINIDRWRTRWQLLQTCWQNYMSARTDTEKIHGQCFFKFDYRRPHCAFHLVSLSVCLSVHTVDSKTENWELSTSWVNDRTVLGSKGQSSNFKVTGGGNTKTARREGRTSCRPLGLHFLVKLLYDSPIASIQTFRHFADSVGAWRHSANWVTHYYTNWLTVWGLIFEAS